MVVKSNVIGYKRGAETSASSAYEVSDVVPHAGRMVLIEKICAFDEGSLTAQLVIRDTSMFLSEDNTVPVRVGIEYMAQTIAAWAGVQAKLAGQPIKIGYLLGSRRYKSLITSFSIGDVLTVTVDKAYEANDIGVFDCQIFLQGKPVVSATLNVYQPQ